MSADGTKRTCSIKLVMSAFDPKRTRRRSWVKHSTTRRWIRFFAKRAGAGAALALVVRPDLSRSYRLRSAL